MNEIPARRPRDQAIDILRGLALLTITVNHLTGIVVRGGMREPVFPTLSHWGFSSAAEIFFLLSGYLVGAVYLSANRQHGLEGFTRKIYARAGKLYLYNLLLFLLVLPICWMSPLLARLSFFEYFIAGGPLAFAGFLIGYIQPYCLEILAVYTLLMLTAPLFAWLLLRRPALAIGASVTLYAVAYHYPWLRPPGGMPAGEWKWNFGPGSWQLLFFGALAAGRFALLDRVRRAFVADRRWLIAAFALFAGLTMLFVAQEPFGFQVWGQSKVRVGPARVIHVLSVCLLVLGLLWRMPWLQSLRASRYVAAVGSASLQCFLASVVISYLAGFIWIELTRNHAAYLLLCGASLVALLLFAQGHRQLRALLASPRTAAQTA
ncbi:hypothetical protein CLG96_13345 [Sphingomonas oleivorans]|uniref:Acyltransferase n=2 Tax=Sphingomonas oleivorans TaxID=1735121 RepID=A0A2T5FX23_9SPHN|nr:hypothetical protein CLG96_13345 [Sphingomonas oleivorans]